MCESRVDGAAVCPTVPMNELHYYSADLASRIIRRAQCCIGLFAWVAEALKAKGLRITTKVLQEGHDVPR